MFFAESIGNENIALSHMIWTKVQCVCSVQSATGSNYKLSLSFQMTHIPEQLSDVSMLLVL